MDITQGRILKGKDFLISSPTGVYQNSALINIAHVNDPNTTVCAIRAGLLDQLIMRKVDGLITIVTINNKDTLQAIDLKLLKIIKEEFGQSLDRETITIHITKGQTVPNYPGLVVMSATGDYEDNVLIECAKIESPNQTFCAFHAGYVDRGDSYYGT